MITIDILEAVKNRRTIHLFKTEEVPEDLLLKIFDYASWAPTHYLKQPWNVKVYQREGKKRFVEAILNSYERIGMLDNEDERKKEMMVQSIRKFLLHIPHHVLIYFPKPKDQIQYEEDYASVCAFLQNAQLVGWKFSVGMLWTITPYMHDPLFAEDIGIDNNKYKIAAVMQVGYPKTVPEPKERIPIEEKLQFITRSW